MKQYLILSFFFLLVYSCSVYDIMFTPTPSKILSNNHFQWISDTTTQVIYNYEKNVYSKENIGTIKRITQKSIERILGLINEEKYPKKIQFIIVSSKEKMKELTGFTLNAFSYPRLDAVYAISEKDIYAIGAHEFNHVIVENLWGNSENWLKEGFAVYSDDEWHNNNLYSLNKYLLNKNKLVSLTKLVDNFDSYSSLITYPESGCFVEYLYERYGEDKFKELWKFGNGNIQKIFGKNLDEIEKEWIEEIKKHDTKEINYEL